LWENLLYNLHSPSHIFHLHIWIWKGLLAEIYYPILHLYNFWCVSFLYFQIGHLFLKNSISFSGFVGNTYTILVMMFRKRLYTACTPYLISVSMADLVMTAVILPGGQLCAAMMSWVGCLLTDSGIIILFAENN
jgi:hypothetical protein